MERRCAKSPSASISKFAGCFLADAASPEACRAHDQASDSIVPALIGLQNAGMGYGGMGSGGIGGGMSRSRGCGRQRGIIRPLIRGAVGSGIEEVGKRFNMRS